MIRTADELIDKIAAELVWRRRELTDLRGLVHGEKGALRSKVLIRASIVLLYAHWEGFVKKSGSYYLEFVAAQRVPYSDLTANFVALKLKSKFMEMGASGKVASGNAVAEFFCTAMTARSNVPFKNIVDTQSNLSSSVLEDILAALGLDASVFETKLKFIDVNLVNPRNHVAHGEAIGLSVDEYVVLHDNVIKLIEAFRTEIENACVLKRYVRAVIPAAP